MGRIYSYLSNFVFVDQTVIQAFMQCHAGSLNSIMFHCRLRKIGLSICMASHVVPSQKKAHILLVTLNKQGRADEHKYMDHWIDDTHFHWQSQNATDPTSKRGDEIIRHAALGIDIHLFVRDSKLAAGKAAPFSYHGRVRYQSHQGSRPMSIVFGLQSGAD
jgi:hypothetical protein